jgi:O-antigen ligase
MIAIAGGTRGTWLGMAVGGFAMLFCGPTGRRWLGWQIPAALAGCAFYWVIFSELSSLFDIHTLNPAGERLTSNLSAREVIWQQAIEMIEARPLLGFGPMHFADIANEIAAHPHQSILQWASEWGIPSALMVGWLAFRGLRATALLIRVNSPSDKPVDRLRICLWASLIGALAQSMVDGVIVMPYSQLWLCIIVGWLLGMHNWQRFAVRVNKVYLTCFFATLGVALIFLGYVVVSDAPLLKANRQLYQSEFGGHFQPRFWMQGVIANTPAWQLLHDPSPDTFSSTPK